MSPATAPASLADHGNQGIKSPWLRRMAWASMLANIVIIGTGGAVRLTGSGLGCPTWPLCTPGSLLPTEELTWHSAVEFGNRLMTGVLSVLALAVLILVWRYRKQRPDLFALAWVMLAGVLAQAVVGGIIVITGLNPLIVGFHYFASILMVTVGTVFVMRMTQAPGPRVKVVKDSIWLTTTLIAVLSVATIFVGIITTGVGPHSGDANVQRTGIDAQLLAHMHAWPGYALLTVTVIGLILAYATNASTRKFFAALLVLQLVQVAIGIYQANFGLPPIAVGAHMVLAAILASITTAMIVRSSKPHSLAD
ncbi:COX15/CtaA family protein [Canibacter zhoujuaniae]|uniref:COX15/CtaA family protein n=1 Tax=Canibacter zhoujuaniae TaxID=2708343 RepID=UPI0014235D8F|nr:COX15/CtaA family protein [Canibacter zhoujuaniae]